MKKIFPFALTLISLASFAEGDSHSLGAHVHGSIKVGMAVEGKSVDITIDGPTEAFVGFEYVPKSAQEKKIWADAENLWTKNLITKLFILENAQNCRVSNAVFQQEEDLSPPSKTPKKEIAIHSDIMAVAKITCKEALQGKSITVALKKYFPNIKKLEVELIGSEIKNIAIDSPEQTIKM